jgi:hypothetical protein
VDRVHWGAQVARVRVGNPSPLRSANAAHRVGQFCRMILVILADK